MRVIPSERAASEDVASECDRNPVCGDLTVIPKCDPICLHDV